MLMYADVCGVCRRMLTYVLAVDLVTDLAFSSVLHRSEGLFSVRPGTETVSYYFGSNLQLRFGRLHYRDTVLIRTVV